MRIYFVIRDVANDSWCIIVNSSELRYSFKNQFSCKRREDAVLELVARARKINGDSLEYEILFLFQKYFFLRKKSDVCYKYKYYLKNF